MTGISPADSALRAASEYGSWPWRRQDTASPCGDGWASASGTCSTGWPWNMAPTRRCLSVTSGIKAHLHGLLD